LFRNDEKQVISLKELNEKAEENGCDGVSVKLIKAMLNFWEIKHLIKRRNMEYSKNHIAVHCLYSPEELAEKQEARHNLALYVVEYLYEKNNRAPNEENTTTKEEVAVEFSVNELKEAFERNVVSFGTTVSIADVEDVLFYLSKIEIIKMEGGFLVTYNGLRIERMERDSRKQYKIEDYKKLDQFYANKVQQIHIVGEYAKKMIHDYEGALRFVDDYFQLNYGSFLNKYFKNRQGEIARNITPTKFRQLFGELSPAQLNIIKDNTSKYMVVAAGPGSGKTRVLVHKLASLLLMEDVKHEQLLMLTFSRAAATEFKKRLLKLIGNVANFVEIKTFHSYSFDLLGKVGSLEKSNDILKRTVEKIRSGEVDPSRITKTVLVIDEAQDMNEDEFCLIKCLMERNEEMRLIAVGDDDQSIYGFRQSSAVYMERFIQEYGARKYELIDNYRSKNNLVELGNQFVKDINHRLKTMPIEARQRDNGGIRILHQQSNELVVPLVQELLRTELRGTTCVLTRKNEEALQIVGLLLRHRIRAKLIQTNDVFKLANLLEIRIFRDLVNAGNDVHTISDEVWEGAKRTLSGVFARSDKWELCLNLLNDFEITNPKIKYKSDFNGFVCESKLEDFFREDIETVFVSTIHKAKGKEYDNVFLMLGNFNLTTDEEKRLLYVAMTRAKRNLIIVLNGNYLNHLSVENMEWKEDTTFYSAPDEIVMQLTHKDVYLNYFHHVQSLIEPLTSGDALAVNGDTYLHNERGERLLMFSQKLMGCIKERRDNGYVLQSAKVNFIVYWWWEEQQREIKIVLPEIRFVRG
ncbi:MAG: ATP-dependent helicase, partial [Prevotellaceae bacterium]|nr:ATP-dependent helicase [Prevotellaceae bacterium]